jgi:DNA-binding response OmpR family regulator
MTPSEGKQMKVLLVDDDTPNLELYRLAFTMRGHQVLTAMSGSEGLKVFEQERPDAVIVDLILGDMVGTEVIARMREVQDSSFYILSETDSAILNSAARKAGVHGFQKLGVPVGEVVKVVSENFSQKVG